MGVEFTERTNEAAMNSIKNIPMKILLDISNDVVKKSKELAPVDTGALRDSIAIFEYNSDEGYTIVGSDVWYGIIQELGSSVIKTTPHLRPAAEIVLNTKRSNL